MKILTILGEAGKPVISNHQVDRNIDRRQLKDKIESLGGGRALEEVLADNSKLLFRGLHSGTNAGAILVQDTMASVRKSQNTSNYVTLLTEMLPSWKRANVLPRSKIVSCTNDYDKADEYGVPYIALPCQDATCAYTGSHDFWDAFEGLNHLYGNESGTGAIPAINEAFEQYATFPVHTTSDMARLCQQLENDLESGKIREEDLNPELKALFESDPETYNVLEILDNLLDPSHMRQSHSGALLVGGDFKGMGEEVQIGGNIVFVEYNLFMKTFGLN